jgi:hypothetical protein
VGVHHRFTRAIFHNRAHGRTAYSMPRRPL